MVQDQQVPVCNPEAITLCPLMLIMGIWWLTMVPE